MAEGCLHEVDRRAALEAVAGMGMAQPVRRHLSGQPGPLGRVKRETVETTEA